MTTPTYGHLNTNNLPQFISFCHTCGALVFLVGDHNRWHEQQHTPPLRYTPPALPEDTP